MGTIEDIKAKADIVSIISERISVKKAGKHFKALCPFHGEKSPSFMISPELQIYKCFGCGEGGDVISFLEKYEGMDFNEAIKYLSDKTGVKLDSGSFQPKKDKEKIIEINDLASKYYNYLLLKHELGKNALKYLLEVRKLTIDTIKYFKIGFSPNNQKIFESFFINKKGLKNKDLVSAGICYERYGRVFDRFSDRIVFPLFDHRGNTVGFSGRILPNSKPDLAKFINTPETPAYHKSEVLFGLNFTKNDIKKAGLAIVTEGEFDMISPWQRGVKNIVAIKGSALTEAHANLLGRFTKKITLALDSDFAGNAAAKRGIEVAQKMGLKVNVCQLGEYKDPDELAIKNIDKFSDSIKKAVPIYDFIIDSVVKKFDLATVDGKVDISREVVPVLSRIDDEIIKAYYVEVLAKKLKVPYESVYKEVEKNNISKITSDSKEKEYEEKVQGKREQLEEALLVLVMMASPQEILDYKDYFKSSFIVKIIGQLVLFSKKSDFEIKEFSQSLPAELAQRFNEMYLNNTKGIDKFDTPSLQSEVNALKKALETFNLTKSQGEIIKKIQDSEKLHDKDEVLKYQKKLNELVKTKLILEGKH